MSARAGGRRGMTLMELVVGLTVTGLALSGGYAALAVSVDQRIRASEAVEAVARAAAERRLIADWVGGARLTPEEASPPFTGLDGSEGGVADDELSFSTVATVEGEARPTLVRLFVDRDSTTPERGLAAELTGWGAARGTRVEIEPAVAGLDLRYHTRMLGNSEWLPSWISSTILPVAVEVTLGAAPGDSLPGLLRLPILVPLGNQR